MSTKEYCFCVAGFWINICFPEIWDVAMALPSFRHFLHEKCDGKDKLMNCVVQSTSDGHLTENFGVLIDETVNDMGCVRLFSNPEGYCVALSASADGITHIMQASKDFSDVNIWLCPKDKEAWRMLSSLLRIAYSQAILYHEAVAVHASVVSTDDCGYLFMGKSGTGKSTHSSLWLKYIPGTKLLNDDNPTVRIVDGKAYVWGTPWSGKTPCYEDCCCPVGGMVRLNKAMENKFHFQEGADAFVTIYPGCSAVCQDEALRSMLYDTVALLAEMIPVGVLDCRPDKEAALLCYRTLCEAHSTKKNI